MAMAWAGLHVGSAMTARSGDRSSENVLANRLGVTTSVQVQDPPPSASRPSNAMRARTALVFTLPIAVLSLIPTLVGETVSGEAQCRAHVKVFEQSMAQLGQGDLWRSMMSECHEDSRPSFVKCGLLKCGGLWSQETQSSQSKGEQERARHAAEMAARQRLEDDRMQQRAEESRRRHQWYAERAAAKLKAEQEYMEQHQLELPPSLDTSLD